MAIAVVPKEVILHLVLRPWKDMNPAFVSPIVHVWNTAAHASLLQAVHVRVTPVHALDSIAHASLLVVRCTVYKTWLSFGS